MKEYGFLLITLILMSSCSEAVQQDEFVRKKNEEEKEYLIAYNIHMPDTAVDDWEVMVMNFDGTGKGNVTQSKDVAWTYHAFIDKIFFISDRDSLYRHFFLYETNPEGKNVRRVSDLRLEDSWMSLRNQGTEMVVSGRIGNKIRYQLFLIDLVTGKYTQVTADTSARFLDPCFSPDGKQVVVSYQKEKRDKNSHEELYVMNLDGSGMNRITYYPEDNVSAKEYGYKAGSARWHPTENYISYVSFLDGRNHILAVTPDGKKQYRLFETKLSVSWHDWSSDGKWLTFNGTSDDKQFHIYLMNWKTKEVKQLTDTAYRSQLGPVFIERGN